MTKILFATTNSAKIARVKKLIQDLPIELLILSDLDAVPEEQEEVGDTVVEIAENKAKAYWEAISGKYPVLAQDDAMDFLSNVEDSDDLSTSIKAPVVKAFGEFNKENAIKYYGGLAEKYGGKVDFVFRYGHALVDENGVKSAESKLSARLVSEPKGIDKIGKYPLRALTQLNVDGTYTYSADASDEQKVEADKDLKRALHELFE